MTFLEGLRNARSHFVFLLAMMSAGMLVLWLEAWKPGNSLLVKQSVQADALEIPAASASR